MTPPVHIEADTLIGVSLGTLFCLWLAWLAVGSFISCWRYLRGQEVFDWQPLPLIGHLLVWRAARRVLHP